MFIFHQLHKSRAKNSNGKETMHWYLIHNERSGKKVVQFRVFLLSCEVLTKNNAQKVWDRINADVEYKKEIESHIINSADRHSFSGPAIYALIIEYVKNKLWDDLLGSFEKVSGIEIDISTEYSRGTENGYKYGYKQGYKEGFEEGNKESHEQYKSGYTIGYSKGYADAFAAFLENMTDNIKQSFGESLNLNYLQHKAYYDILDLKPDGTSRDLKDRFRALVKKYHPDTGRESSDAHMFGKIKEAYDILSKVLV